LIRLAPTKKLRYAVSVVCGAFPPRPLSVVPVTVQNLVKEGCRMTCKNTWAGLVLAVVLSLSLTACKDTTTLQENERLKAQVAELQKETGQLGNNLETLTAARDALTKENEALRAEIKVRKTKRTGTKAASRKRRRSSKSSQS
jgi:cell division protein FtsB